MSTKSPSVADPRSTLANSAKNDPSSGTIESGYEFLFLKKPGRQVTKYVFIQDDASYLPKVLDKFLREFGDSTVGINLQKNTQGKRSLFETAMELFKVYGFWYFQAKVRQILWNKLIARLGLLSKNQRSLRSVPTVAKKWGVPIHETRDVNSEEFRAKLKTLGVELIVSISGTQLYKKDLRLQTPFGILNCHGALLPKYRGLMPSFWTLANGESWGGVSIHYVDRKLDNGPIVVQRKYRIHPSDSLEAVMGRSKDLVAEALIDAVRLVESGEPNLIANPENEMTHFGLPTKADVKRFRHNGHKFR